ncbi:nuclear distribution protein nudE-like 1-B [Nilaparvata lugens]|uniref:nuclear distribution protein nudE-like 1-B n=1 Tax=Nilaparvata lugens TaxID=108931 RepID=UPI00193E82B1|nr:nuclear distribution protein nudE-like 1-B [Nilaparvata lugens]
MPPQVPKFINKDEEIEYWRNRSCDIEKEFDELQESSKQYEKELEASIFETERENKNLRNYFSSLKLDFEIFKEKAEKQEYEQTTKLEKLESKRSQLETNNVNHLSYIRQLEQKNDDLDRSQRVLHESLKEIETRLNSTIERNALLESEKDQLEKEKEQLESHVQRLKDEVRDLKQDINHRSREPSCNEEVMNSCSRKSSLKSIDSSKSLTQMTPLRTAAETQTLFMIRHMSTRSTPVEFAEILLRKIEETEAKLKACSLIKRINKKLQ